MSEQTSTQISSPSATENNDVMMKQLLEQVKMLTEAQTLKDQELTQVKEANAAYAEQVEKSEAAGKRKRENALDNGIKEYFQQLMAKYETELKPHEAELDGMMEAMKSNSSSEPLVQALACAAAAAKGSVTELEESYQANKKMKLEIEELKKTFSEQSKPLFSKKEERVETVEAQASATTAPKTPASFNSIFGGVVARTPATMKGAGMRERDPDMWKDLLASAPRTRGMPKVDAFLNMMIKK